jgi:hypothetical protein
MRNLVTVEFVLSVTTKRATIECTDSAADRTKNLFLFNCLREIRA